MSNPNFRSDIDTVISAFPHLTLTEIAEHYAAGADALELEKTHAHWQDRAAECKWIAEEVSARAQVQP